MRSCFWRGTTVKAALTRKRKYLLWPVVFWGGFRVCRADAETDHKCHRGKPVGRGRWRTDDFDTGDNGHSATSTSIRVEASPYQPRSEPRRVCGWSGSRCSEERSDERNMQPRKTQIRPLTALGRFGRLGASAERLSSLERKKRSIIKDIGHSRYLACGGLL